MDEHAVGRADLSGLRGQAGRRRRGDLAAHRHRVARDLVGHRRDGGAVGGTAVHPERRRLHGGRDDRRPGTGRGPAPQQRHARWPIFAAAVAEQTDVRALFALPLQWGAVNVGVLDLYRSTPGRLSTAQCRDAISAAETARVDAARRCAPTPDNACGRGAAGLAGPCTQQPGRDPPGHRHRARPAGGQRAASPGPDARLRVRRPAAADRRRPRCRGIGACVFTEEMRVAARVATGGGHSMNPAETDREHLISRAFVSLADTLVDDYDVIDLLDRLVGYSVALLAADAAGIVLGDARRRLRAVAASSEDAQTDGTVAAASRRRPVPGLLPSGAPVRRHRPGPRRPTGGRGSSAAVADSAALPLGPRAATAAARAGDRGAEPVSPHARPASPSRPSLGQALADVATIGILQNAPSAAARSSTSSSRPR